MEHADDLREVEKHYRRRVIEDFERLTFQGIARSGRAVSLKLEDVYVELKAVADVPDAADTYSAEERRLLLEAVARGMPEGDLRRQLDSLRVERWREESRRPESRFVRRSIEETLIDSSRPGLVILGDPGSGKSTLLKYLALRAGHEEWTVSSETPPRRLLLRSANGAPLLPIFVPLAAYDDWLRRDAHGHMPLVDFLPVYQQNWCNRPGLGTLFQRALTEGRALVLLDGLDEVLDVATRQHISKQVNLLIQAHAGRGNRFAVTSRIVGYREAPLPGDLPHVTVLDFGEPEIATFARRWCVACEIWLTGERTEKTVHNAAREEAALLSEVKANPSVLRLAANPLLLTMLALLRRQGGKLPDERVKLYQRYTEMLLDSGWENARSEGARTKAVSRFDQSLATSYLMELALWLQRFKPSGTARKSDLLAALVEIALKEEGLEPVQASPKERREARAKAEHFVQEMRHFAGLLAERGQDAYGFLHLTFQEYFAARALARMEAGERGAVLKENLHQPRWREPILLCAGQLGIVEKRTREVGELVRRILASASPYESYLHRDVLLATAIVTDGVGVDRALQDELERELEIFTEDLVPAVREEALQGLVRLAQCGHERAALWLEAKIRSRAQNFAEVTDAVHTVIDAEWCTGISESLIECIDDSDLGYIAIKVLAPLLERVPGLRDVFIEKIDELSDGGYKQRMLVVALGDLALSDKAARDFLVKKLDDTSSEIQSSAVRALEALVIDDEDVRERLIEKLNSSHIGICGAAIASLASLVPGDNKKVRKNILDKLDDSESWIRELTVSALAPFAAGDEEVRSKLIKLLADPSAHVRAHVAELIGHLAVHNPEDRKQIILLTNDPSDRVRIAALRVLAPLALSDKDVRDTLLSRISDTAPYVCMEAMEALGPLISAYDEIRSLVINKLDNAAWPVLPVMIEALTHLIPVDEGVRNLVTEKLKDPEAQVRVAAVRSISSLGWDDPAVRSCILKMLDDTDDYVRWATIDALRSHIANHEDVQEAVLGKIDDPDIDVQMITIEALRAFAPINKGIRDRIVDKVNSEEGNIRAAALRALTHLVVNDDEVRHLVLGNLDSPNVNVGMAAMMAIGPLAEHDETIRSRLLSALDNDKIPMRIAATEALAPLISTHQNIRRRLLDSLDDSNIDVRDVALKLVCSFALSDDSALGRILELKRPNLDAELISILRPQVSSELRIRDWLIRMLDEPEAEGHEYAILGLAPLISKDPEVRRTILLRLNDDKGEVRRAAAAAAAELIGLEPELRETLLDWLGIVGEDGVNEIEKLRMQLASAYSRVLEQEPVLLRKAVEMLRSPAWPRRKGAAWALIGMPSGPPAEVLPLLRELLNDNRGEESWSVRIRAASLLINDRDLEVRQHALAVTMGALDYATQAWYDLPYSGGRIREDAARVLGTLEPEYRCDTTLRRLLQLLQEDLGEAVRNAAYCALLRLTVAPDAEYDVESLARSDQPMAISFSPPSFGMRSLPDSVVVHLSDLHFGTRQEADMWYSQLAEDLKQELSISRISAVILSGDIANKSTAEEYDAALSFLGRLQAEFGLSSERIIPVPGNHDLDWGLAEEAYRLVKRRDYRGPLEEGRFKDIGSGAIYVCDPALYLQRFSPFAAFYNALRSEPYPLEPERQALLYPLPEERLLIVGLNSAWNLDHHFKERASINAQALSNALDQIRKEPSYKDFLKVAVWHHPVHSGFPDRITDHGFLEQLAKAEFRLALHGHIHKAQSNLFRYDMNSAGRRLEIVCAGTFGAPTRELVPGYPFQYQILRFGGASVTVETRRREEIHGAWKPDARWTTERGGDPVPRYTLPLI